MARPITILSIAGSDNSSGAGIQADIKTCYSLNAYCLTALTCVTSQNSNSFSGIFCLSSRIIISQINVLLKDFKVDAIKIGLVPNYRIAKTISLVLKKKKIPIVIDPIMKPTNMKKFYSKKDYILVNKTLSSLKPLFTPNLNEANFLLNKKEPNIEKIFESLENFYKSDFVITGGDAESSFCEDYLKENKKIYRLKSKKLKSSSTHGSGCSFSTALTVFLAKGYSKLESVRRSKRFVEQKIISAPKLGVKYGPIA